MADPVRIAAIVEEFTRESPAQQLVDRLLIGYPQAGAFHRPHVESVTIHAPSSVGHKEIGRRGNDFGLRRADDPAVLAAECNAVVVVPKGSSPSPAATVLHRTLRAVRPGTRIFVHGVLAADVAAARRTVDLAASRKVSLLAGSYMPTTWRLPEVDLARGTAITEALIVTVGKPGEAELLGLDGLLPVIERRLATINGRPPPGEAGVRSVRALTGEAVWQALHDGEWSRGLLGAAVSRSDTPQGDPVKDGRTQDLVGLGLVEKLAKDPVAYRIEHRDGLHSTILIANGVVADVNFAVRTRTGDTVSAQLFRPRAPQAQHWSTLTAHVERFFQTGKPPWPIQRSLLTAGLLATFREARARPGETIQTADLAIPYPAPARATFCRT